MPHRSKLAIFCFIIVMTSAATIIADPIDIWSEHQIATGYKNFTQMDLFDIDGDSDLDIVTGSADFGNGRISWWENDSHGVFTEHNIAATGEYRGVYFRDANDDGAIDIFNHIGSTHTLPFTVTVWLNNGSMVFSKNDIYISSGNIFNIDPTDLDGDGDQDVVLSQREPDGLIWLRNEGGLIFTEHIVGVFAYPSWARGYDLDGDGDQDIVVESPENNEVAWWENDGNESFTKHTIASISSLHNYHISDLDYDGDADIVIGTWGVEGLVWLENDGSQSFTVRQISATNDSYSHHDVADLDADGDYDLASTTGSAVLWYENDGSESFTEHLIRNGMSGARGVHADYIDSDLQMDLIALGYYQREMSWWQQGTTTVNANLSCVPAFSTLPFNETLTLTVTNLDANHTRRVDLRLDLHQANGQYYSNWRRGYTNIAGGSDFIAVLVEPVPNIADLIGVNTVQFIVEDVTPSPYNQPPYLPAGDTDRSACTVTGYAP